MFCRLVLFETQDAPRFLEECYKTLNPSKPDQENPEPELTFIADPEYGISPLHEFLGYGIKVGDQQPASGTGS